MAIKIEIYIKIGIFVLFICVLKEYLAENAKNSEQLEMGNEQCAFRFALSGKTIYF
ncbi:MAG: hypothetical protein IJV35_05225 [Neisseriaceae bacterium]|nr:hypothetical protein [Neisseriaceae bacterium]